jgi:hypothetical protein
MHCLWTLPQGDADFPGRWRAIKTGFAKSLPIGEPRSPVMTSRGERGIRRQYELTHFQTSAVSNLGRLGVKCARHPRSVERWGKSKLNRT